MTNCKITTQMVKSLGLVCWPIAVTHFTLLKLIATSMHWKHSIGARIKMLCCGRDREAVQYNSLFRQWILTGSWLRRCPIGCWCPRPRLARLHQATPSYPEHESSQPGGNDRRVGRHIEILLLLQWNILPHLQRWESRWLWGKHLLKSHGWKWPSNEKLEGKVDLHCTNL